MDFYTSSLGLLVAVNTGLLWAQYRRRKSGGVFASDKNSPSSASSRNFHLTFFVPYTMAVAIDWLQGPHIYAMYKYEKDLPEKVVAALYATGFAAGGISASFAGTLADRFGRKRACLLYCALYFCTCLSMLSGSLVVLFLGRLAGGVSTTLLFSVFEAWMISDYHERGLHIPAVDPDAGASTAGWDKEGGGAVVVDVQETGGGGAEWAQQQGAEAASSTPLDGIFSTMTTLSCVVAIASGVVGDVLVTASGTRTWPFMAGMFCSVMAAAIIATSWRENYGSTSLSSSGGGGGPSSPSGTTVRRRFAFLRVPKILALGLTTCVFEGTMYLFIFFWSAALKNARDIGLSSSSAAAAAATELPFGLIFSSFMCTMLAGSALFGRLRSRGARNVDILLGVLLVVSGCLGLTVGVQDERLLFLAFCVIEGCIGVYFPAMASLKSQLVDDDIRGRVYSVLRAPLNVFVVVAHCLDEEGSLHRNNVFLTCATLLLVAFLVTRHYFPK